jgi:GT2 family glycosyltransferase
MKVYIVIVTYNAENWIRNCIKSIHESTVKSSVVIVDNNSSDNTLAIISNEYPNCTLIKNNANKGFGYANNIGIRYSLEKGADYVTLLNQDAKLNAYSLGQFISYSNKYPDYGILAPMIYSYNGLELDEYLLNWTFRYNLPLASDVFFDRVNEVYHVSLVPAAVWFMRREAITDVGLFDPLFFMYAEDDDLWGRFVSKGWKVGFFPKVIAYHHTSKDGGYSLQKRKWQTYGLMVLGLKHGSKSFFQCFSKFILNYVARTISSIAFLNRSEFYILNVSFFSVLFKINKVYRNRNICLKTKGAFIAHYN